MDRFKVAIVATHPIQYYVPWYRALAEHVDLTVFYCHRQTATGQANAGFGVAFDWDIPLLDGYHHVFLTNVSKQPGVDGFRGCDTPDIAQHIERERFDAVVVHGLVDAEVTGRRFGACWRTRTPVLVARRLDAGDAAAWLVAFREGPGLFARSSRASMGI